jgi:hypothetical protein
MMKHATVAIALTTLAGSASAQCGFYRYGVPDFDQRRDALGGNGSNHCVPTSFTNLRGYIANHGYGNIMSGPRNWQSQANYNYVTDRIDAMGIYMDTDPSGGTNGDDAIDGWNDFIDDWHDDKFTLNAWFGSVPGMWIYLEFLTGGLTNICYGYYKFAGGEWDRDGGHCVSLVGISDLCDSPFEPTVRIRDPASDDGDLDVQSPFAYSTSRTELQSFNYDGGVSRLRLLDFGAGSSTRRYIDKLYSIRPQICLTGGLSTFALQLHAPVQLFGISLPSSTSDSPSPGYEISQIAIHPMGYEAYILKHDAAATNWRLYRYNLGTGEWTTALPTFPSSNKAVIAISRFGHLFVYGDGSVKKYDANLGALPLLASTTPPAPIVDMEFDDHLDELVAITSTNRFLKFDHGLLLPAVNEPLPTGVAIVGDGSVFPDPTAPDRWYVASSGSPTMHRLVPATPGIDRLRIDAAITFPPGTEPRHLNMTDSGHLVFLDRGQVADWKLVIGAAGNIWEPDGTSAVGGLPGQRALLVPRSRNNYEARLHGAVNWQDDTYEEEGAPVIPDCNPDLNGDGEADILDFLLFIDSFSECEGDAAPCGINGVDADYLDDGKVDILDFLTFIDDFSYGCD